MEYLFETKHLRFRRFEILDAHSLYQNHLEDEMKQWIPNESYESIHETEQAINFYMSCVNKRQLPYVLAVERKENGILVGDTGVNLVQGSDDEVEIGYSVCKKHSGNGYGTEIVMGITDYIKKVLGIHVLYGRVMKGNVASIRVMEKSGYVFIEEELGAEDDPYGMGILVFRNVV